MFIDWILFVCCIYDFIAMYMLLYDGIDNIGIVLNLL